jgi:GNAT superfamily N-acetyltransferase
MSLAIRPARPGDGALVLQFVKDLAEYERRRHEVVATAADMEAALFGADRTCFCFFAEWSGEVAGFALSYFTFSTFAGRRGVYLEDLFVHPRFRGHGIGKALLRHLARETVGRGCDRLTWSVLTWNEPAIRFYERLGAARVDDWHSMGLDGVALTSLAAFAGGEGQGG